MAQEFGCFGRSFSVVHAHEAVACTAQPDMRCIPQHAFSFYWEDMHTMLDD